MMLCQQILGNIENSRIRDKKIDYVDIEWHEAFKKIHRKTTRDGAEIGIRLDDGILTKGIRQGDILWEEGENVIAVNIPDCDVIEIWISRNHPEMTAKVCYEIGTCHASLFCGRDRNSFITPYSEPMLHMLNQIPGISVTVKQAKLDFDKRISAGVSAHTH